MLSIMSLAVYIKRDGNCNLSGRCRGLDGGRLGNQPPLTIRQYIYIYNIYIYNLYIYIYMIPSDTIKYGIDTVRFR